MTRPRPEGAKINSLEPVPKVYAAGVAGAAAIVLIWLAGRFGVEMPPEVAAAATALLGAGAAYLKGNGR